MSTEPEYTPQSGWTVPEGYAYPKCLRCGHNFFGRKPQPKVDGKSPDGGECQWCLEELQDY